MPSIADSVAAREAVEQYLDALARRDYARAAWLHVGEWRPVARHVEEDAGDTLSLAGFLRLACGRGYFTCGLRLRRVTAVQFVAPDTLKLAIEYSDSTGALFRWGPCCGAVGPPETTARMTAVARDSGYAVVELPLYIP